VLNFKQITKACRLLFQIRTGTCRKNKTGALTPQVLAPSKGLKTQGYLSKSLKTSRIRKKALEDAAGSPAATERFQEMKRNQNMFGPAGKNLSTSEPRVQHTDYDYYMRNADVCNSSWQKKRK